MTILLLVFTHFNNWPFIFHWVKKQQKRIFTSILVINRSSNSQRSLVIGWARILTTNWDFGRAHQKRNAMQLHANSNCKCGKCEGSQKSPATGYQIRTDDHQNKLFGECTPLRILHASAFPSPCNNALRKFWVAGYQVTLRETCLFSVLPCPRFWVKFLLCSLLPARHCPSLLL